MKILLIDNYDSFTYNLYHYLSSLNTRVDVIRNDKINSQEIIKKKYKKIVISPGPGNPDQAGNCIKCGTKCPGFIEENAGDWGAKRLPVSF